MPYQHLIKYMKNGEIFNTYFKEQITELYDNFGTLKENNLFKYKTYTIEGKYGSDEFYIVDNENELTYKDLKTISAEEPRVFKYSHELLDIPGKVFQSEDYVDVMKIITHIHTLDASIGKKMLDIYHFLCAEHAEVAEFSDSVFAIQKVLHTYLKENNLYQNTVEVNYDPNNDESITEWFQSVYKKESKYLPAYNDSDFTPFLIIGNDNKEYYVIEDVSSNKLFIYKSEDANSGSWYMVPRNDFKNVSDNLHVALYESKQYITKNIEENLNDFSLIAEYENRKIIKATSRLDDLNLIQGYIYGQLYVEKKVKLDVNDSFPYMLANYRKDHDYYKHDIDEVHFFDFLNKIKENPGSLYYHNYQYHTNHDNTPRTDYVEAKLLRTVENNVDYSHLKQLSHTYQNQIAQYIEEKMEKFSNHDKVKAHLTAIKDVLSNTSDNTNNIEQQPIGKIDSRKLHI